MPKKETGFFPLAKNTPLSDDARRAFRELQDCQFEFESVIREDSVECEFRLHELSVRLQSFEDHYAIGKVQIIGGYDPDAGHFIWGCDQGDYPADVTKDAITTRDRLVEHLPMLMVSPVPCSPADAMSISALAWKWSNAEFALTYCETGSRVQTFINVDDIEVVESAE